MTDQDSLARETMILDMFDGFPDSTKIERAHTKAYAAATDDVSFDALRRAVDDFRRGRVERFAMDKPPSSAELAIRARLWHEALHPPKPIELLNGLLSIDYGSGPIDLRGLSQQQQDEAMRTGARPAQINSPARVPAKLRGM